MNTVEMGRYPSWSTASLADAALCMPREAYVLGEHMNACRADTGVLLSLRGGAEALHGFVSARFVTTFTVLSLVAGLLLIVVR